MNTQIRDIFDSTLTALNLTIVDTQVDAIFNLVNRKYFSIVKPLSKRLTKDLFIIEIPDSTINIEPIIEGYEVQADADMFALDIGAYKVVEVVEQDNNTFKLKTEPIDYNNYKISLNYTNTYQTTCEAILERFEGINMQTLRGIGVEDIENRLDLNYDMIEQMLYKKHTVLAFGLIVV